MSVRQTIVSLVKAAMLKISKANGYKSDFGTVYEWKITPFDPLEQAIDVQDPRDEVRGQAGDFMHRHTLAVHIVIKAAPGEETIANLRLGIEDVYAAIKTSRNLLEEYEVEPTSDEIFKDQDGRVIGIAVVRLSIIYHTHAWTQTPA